MNKLLCMHAFARLAENGSVAAAGQKLGLSSSAVAKCVARLEAELGVQLMARTTRAMRLTELGETYYHHCLSVLSEIEEGEALLRRENAEPAGAIKLRVPVAFGESSLIPQLARFQELYPRIQLRLRLGDRPADLLAEGLDMAVVSGPLPSSSYIARTLTRGRSVTAASPTYFSRHGTPRTPADLDVHACIAVEGVPWAFMRDGMAVVTALRPQIFVDSESALRDLALGGVGVVQVRSWSIDRELRAGTLRAVLEDCATPPVELIAVCTPQRYMPAKMRAVLDFLGSLVNTVEFPSMSPPSLKRVHPSLPSRSDASAVIPISLPAERLRAHV